MSASAANNAPLKGSAEAASRDFMPALFGLEYSTYGTKPTNFVYSFLLHMLMAVVLVVSTSYVVSHRQEIKATVTGVVTDISPYILPQSSTKAGGGGGGGDRDKLAATKGAPPKFAREQFTPPAIVIRNPDPKLPMDPTVVGPPDLKLATGPTGDPLGVIGPPSNGTGSGGGIGSGSGGGVGSGRGPGVGPGWGGGIGGGPYRVGGGVSAPKALYAPDPEYSEEARKAKYQGTVVLWVVVGPDGRPRDLKVQRTLGMGLDEKAMEAVRTWKFEPARLNGSPVAVQINVEVNFRLY
jgi:TonB family protein